MLSFLCGATHWMLLTLRKQLCVCCRLLSLKPTLLDQTPSCLFVYFVWVLIVQSVQDNVVWRIFHHWTRCRLSFEGWLRRLKVIRHHFWCFYFNHFGDCKPVITFMGLKIKESHLHAKSCCYNQAWARRSPTCFGSQMVVDLSILYLF